MTQGALPLDPTKGSSTLWTPFRAIQLVTTAHYARVFIHEVCISTDSRIKKAHWEFQTSTVGSFIIYAFSTDRKNAFVR